MTGNEHKGTALITGSSTGIGAVYADRLARRGYDLILVARNTEKLASVAERVSSQTGRSVRAVAADLTSRTDLARVEALLRADAAISLLVNNAGVGAVAPLLASNVDEMEAMIGLNVTALTRLTYAVAPAMTSRGQGTIVNIASVVGIAPEVLNGVYGATKAFVIALTRSLQHELASKGLRFQAVLPGAVSTAFWDIAGNPVSNLPASIVMTADDVVDAALVGLDLGELITVPSLPDLADLTAYESARQVLLPNLSRDKPAKRYLA